MYTYYTDSICIYIYTHTFRGELSKDAWNCSTKIALVKFHHGSFNKNGWWCQTFFDFQPYLGKWSILTNLFQRGWNHQLEMSPSLPKTYPIPSHHFWGVELRPPRATLLSQNIFEGTNLGGVQMEKYNVQKKNACFTRNWHLEITIFIRGNSRKLKTIFLSSLFFF